MYQYRHAVLVSNCALLIGQVGCAGSPPARSEVTPGSLESPDSVDDAAVDDGEPAAALAAVDDGEPAGPARAPDALVDITALDRTIRIDIRYSGSNNFTGVAVYPVARCLLRHAVAERLVRVQRALRKRGLGLLIWDCYRPISVQERFWQLVPDARYVARPVIERGVPVRGSKHNRGAAVDLTLVDARGALLAMPTDYDDFSRRAHRGARGVPEAAAANAMVLERAMAAEGFIPLPTEWWHFDAPGWQRYPLADVPLHAP